MVARIGGLVSRTIDSRAEATAARDGRSPTSGSPVSGAYPEGMLAFYQGSAARIRQILEFGPALQMTAEDEQPLRKKLAEYEALIRITQSELVDG